MYFDSYCVNLKKIYINKYVGICINFLSRNNYKNLRGEKLGRGKKRLHFLFYPFFVLFKFIIIVHTLLLCFSFFSFSFVFISFCFTFFLFYYLFYSFFLFFLFFLFFFLHYYIF